MIIKPDSILKYLPVNIEKRQFIILDSIRFSLEIINNSWLSLNNQLISLSTQSSDAIKDLPRLYIDVWNIIDNIQRFIRLYKLLQIKSLPNIIDSIKHIEEFRHTFQHLDERVDQAMIELNVPIYGILTWNYHNPDSKKVDVFITSSGIARYDIKFDFNVTDFDCSKVVDDILFDTIVRKNKNEFKREQLNLSRLASSLTLVVNDIEVFLDKRFLDLKLTRTDWIKRKDILLRFINK